MRISRSWIEDYVDLTGISDDELEDIITTKVAEIDSVEKVASPILGAVLAHIVDVAPHPESEKLSIVKVAVGDDVVTVVCGASNCRADMATLYVPVGAKILGHKADYSKSSGQLSDEMFEVERRVVRGVASSGVLVSEAELGLSADHNGIIDIDELSACDPCFGLLRKKSQLGQSQSGQLKVGCPASDLFGPPDTVFEIDNKSLTHRPDLWSHFGFARELSAILARPLKFNPDRFADDASRGASFEDLYKTLLSDNDLASRIFENNSRLSVHIRDSGCRRFTAVEIENVSTRPTPLWMRRRLSAIGAGCRNLLVDLSNYVMHDVGQPNHAYDRDKLEGGFISARLAVEGEHFRGLDGEDRKLCAQDLVIADGSKIIGLAGVIGGEGPSIHDSTKNIVLESASFDPVVIRRMAKRHQIRTDASNRFEKSQSSFLPPVGLLRFIELLTRIDSEVRVSARATSVFPDPPKDVKVVYSDRYLLQRLGGRVPLAEIKRILISLGFELHPSAQSDESCEGGRLDSRVSANSHKTGDAKNTASLNIAGEFNTARKNMCGEGHDEDLNVALVPYYRATRDVSIADDLVEEVGRIYGYEQLGEDAPNISSVPSHVPPISRLEDQLRDVISASGFNEIYNYSALSAESLSKCGYLPSEGLIELQNAVDSGECLMRPSLVPGMIAVLDRNARFESSQALFEVGRTYHSLEGRVALENRQPCTQERRVLVLGYTVAGRGGDDVYAAIARPSIGYSGVDSGTSFYALASEIRKICRCVSHERLELVTNGQDLFRAWMHPYRWAMIKMKEQVIGVIAEARGDVFEVLRSRAVIAELDLGLLLSVQDKETRFRAFSKYPDSFFEMSVVMPDREPYAKLESLIIRNVEDTVFRGMEVISVYKGAPLIDGQKSISVKLNLGRNDRTLSGDELTSIQQKLVSSLSDNGYSLRS